MTKLILVRHAQSEANAKRIFAGHTDFPLSELGYLQAKASAEYSKKFNISCIYSSDLSRTMQTAEHFSKIHNLPIIPKKELREIYAGEWDGMALAEIKERYQDRYSHWCDGTNMHPVGGEKPEELADRIYQAVEKIAKENDGKTVLVVTHAAAIRTFETLIKTGSMEFLPDYPWVSNASLNFLEYENGEFRFLERDVSQSELKSTLPAGI